MAAIASIGLLSSADALSKQSCGRPLPPKNIEIKDVSTSHISVSFEGQSGSTNWYKGEIYEFAGYEVHEDEDENERWNEKWRYKGNLGPAPSNALDRRVNATNKKQGPYNNLNVSLRSNTKYKLSIYGVREKIWDNDYWVCSDGGPAPAPAAAGNSFSTSKMFWVP